MFAFWGSLLGSGIVLVTAYAVYKIKYDKVNGDEKEYRESECKSKLGVNVPAHQQPPKHSYKDEFEQCDDTIKIHVAMVGRTKFAFGLATERDIAINRINGINFLILDGTDKDVELKQEIIKLRVEINKVMGDEKEYNKMKKIGRYYDIKHKEGGIIEQVEELEKEYKEKCDKLNKNDNTMFFCNLEYMVRR